MKHYSDCAIYNEPALPRGECDCGGLELAHDASHDTVVSTIAGARSCGGNIGDVGSSGLIQPQKLPTDGLIADAATTCLPDAHNRISVLGEADGVDLDTTEVSVVAKL